MPQTRIQEKFYPLTSRIINLLRQGNLTATEWRIWTYLVELDPWGDRYENFDYLSVISVCECSKSSFYRAIAKFQELKIFDFQSRGLCVKNLAGASQLRKPKTEQPNSAPQTKAKTEAKPKPEPEPEPPSNDSEVEDPWDDYPETSDRQEPSVPDLGTQSQNWESSLKAENPVPDVETKSQDCDNEEPKSPSDIKPDQPQTLQISLDPPVQPDGGGAEIKTKVEEVNKSEQVKLQDESKQSESKKAEEKQSERVTSQATEEREIPRDVVQEKAKVEPKPPRTANKRLTKEEIPLDLVEQLEQLNIPLDEIVLSAIASHHISQAYGAAAHVERTWETISNPRGVFLFQLPKQKAQRLGQQLPEIGPKMREQYAAIEEEMATEEYKQKAQELFAKLREIGKWKK